MQHQVWLEGTSSLSLVTHRPEDDVQSKIINATVIECGYSLSFPSPRRFRARRPEATRHAAKSDVALRSSRLVVRNQSHRNSHLSPVLSGARFRRAKTNAPSPASDIEPSRGRRKWGRGNYVLRVTNIKAGNIVHGGLELKPRNPLFRERRRSAGFPPRFLLEGTPRDGRIFAANATIDAEAINQRGNLSVAMANEIGEGRGMK